MIWGWIGLAVLIMPLQFVIAAPYGRHSNRKWGPEINNKVGWIVMEVVSLLAFLYFFWQGTGKTPASAFIAALFIIHYVHRSLIYPFMLRTGNKKMPLAIVVFAILFNVVNGSINGDYLGSHPGQYDLGYFTRPNFIIGFIVFIVGAWINIRSDYYLLSLRKNAPPNTYVIPKGGLFNRISCPNHFGEILEWTGFAIIGWSLPALAFAVWTASNLIPRAWQHHRWYLRKFEDYPKGRKAVIPSIL